MQSTFADRVKAFRKHKRLSQAAFAEQCGLEQGNITQMENGTEPKQSNITKLIAGFPDLAAHWLLTGRGEMLADGRTLTPASQLPPAVPSKLEPYREGFPIPGEANPQQADFVGRLIERLERELAEARERETWYQEMLKKPLASSDAAGFMLAEPATPISMRPRACQPTGKVVAMWPEMDEARKAA